MVLVVYKQHNVISFFILTRRRNCLFSVKYTLYFFQPVGRKHDMIEAEQLNAIYNHLDDLETRNQDIRGYL